MYKVWNEILEFLDLGFDIREFTESEYKRAPDLHIQGYKTGIGYLNGKETTTLKSFYKRTLLEYKDELHELLLLRPDDRNKLVSLRNEDINKSRNLLPDLNGYKKQYRFKIDGKQQVADLHEELGIIPGKVIPTYKPKFNYTRVIALANLYEYLKDVQELNNQFLSDFGAGLKHLNISFNYASTSSYQIDLLYDNLTLYEFIDKEECSKAKFRKMFWKGFNDDKVNWCKSQASFKYFIKNIFKKKQVVGLSHKGKGKWIIASHYFSVGGNEKDEATMSSFDTKISKKDKENLDLILQVFE